MNLVLKMCIIFRVCVYLSLWFVYRASCLCTIVFCPQNGYGFVSLCFVQRMSMAFYNSVWATETVWLCTISCFSFGKYMYPVFPKCSLHVFRQLLIPYSRFSRSFKTDLHELSVPVLPNIFTFFISPPPPKKK